MDHSTAAHLAWLARYLTQSTGRHLTQDEALALVVKEAVERAVFTLFERHFTSPFARSPDLSLMITQGRA